MLDSEKKRNWVKSSLYAIPLIVLTSWLFPEFLPFSTAEIWSFHGTGLVDWLKLGVPVFAWGGAVTLLVVLVNRPTAVGPWERLVAPTKAQRFYNGFILSVWAGVAEEIGFRWLLFLSSYISVFIINFLIFGWLGFGVSEWLYVHVLGPLANFTTLGHLAPWLNGPDWTLGAAILAANAFFRDGHSYLGPLGYVNSWFMGMFFFFVMLTHGLLAAVVIHFVYDLIVFWIGAAFYRA